VTPSPLGTSATNFRIFPAPDFRWWCVVVGGMRIGRGNQSTRRNPAPVPLGLQIPYYFSWVRNWVATVGSWRLITCSIARPKKDIFIRCYIQVNLFLKCISLSRWKGRLLSFRPDHRRLIHTHSRKRRSSSPRTRQLILSNRIFHYQDPRIPRDICVTSHFPSVIKWDVFSYNFIFFLWDYRCGSEKCLFSGIFFWPVLGSVSSAPSMDLANCLYNNGLSIQHFYRENGGSILRRNVVDLLDYRLQDPETTIRIFSKNWCQSLFVFWVLKLTPTL
jgi:hypothetical protein